MSQSLIDFYKAIEDSSQKMLHAAQLENWDEVVRYEGACAVLIEQLRHHALDEHLTQEAKTEKARIMQRILRNDAQIRCLTEPWIQQFSQILESRPQLLH